MGFWSSLAKIGGDVGGAFIGDPMLGNQIGGIADALGGAAQGSAAGEQSMNDSMSKYDANQIAEQNATNQAAINKMLADNTALTTKNDIATKNPSTFARQSVLAGILSNTPSFDSGHGSAITYGGPGDKAKADLAELQAQAGKNLAESPDKNPIPSASTVVSPTLATAPTLTKPTQPGSTLMDKILGGGALAGGVLSSLLNIPKSGSYNTGSDFGSNFESDGGG